MTAERKLSMIRELRENDRKAFISMVEAFFNSDAVQHSIPRENIVNTFDEIMSGSPYAKAYIIEKDGETAGYAQISLTFSNEAGGLVVWIEELYIRERFRGAGLGKGFLAFIRKEFQGKAKRFRLEITETNTSAECMYLRSGYEHLGYRQMILEEEQQGNCSQPG